jgi:hypothetical protein
VEGRLSRQLLIFSIGKMACGHFSDIGFVAAGKKRGFCRLLRRRCARKNSIDVRRVARYVCKLW